VNRVGWGREKKGNKAEIAVHKMTTGHSGRQNDKSLPNYI